jgi:MinD-like ATPase involved in chromosome partitioning or flagellar assembly
MATITLLSAKGSPGVTTVAVALTLAWPSAAPGRRALAVDADPAGGGMAPGVLRGALPDGAGMLQLATARGVAGADALDAACVDLRPDGSARVLAGVPDASRAGALALAWDRITEARSSLDTSDVDLVVDAGRVDTAHANAPWLIDADLAVLLVRPTLPAVTAAHRLAAAWQAPDSPASAVPLALLVVEAPSPYRPHEVAAAVGLPLHGVIPFDPAHARVHAEGAPATRGFARSAYARATSQVARDLAARAAVPPVRQPAAEVA